MMYGQPEGGACINQKPFFYELADKYQDSDDIQFITISVDSSIELAKIFIQKNSKRIINIIIKNGMQTEFGKQYSIYFIPKYNELTRMGKL